MVSVIIPTYNRAKIIKDTIQSVLNQTYSDLEAIVVSDGYCNDTRMTVGAFDDSRLKYYEISHSHRPAVPRNYGMNKAKGEYLAFCDDDDIWMPEKLKLQVDKMSKDKETGLVYTQCLLKDGIKEKLVPHNSKQGFIFKELFLSLCPIAASTVLIRREVIDKIGMFDEDIRLKAVEDYDYWLRIARIYKIGFIDKPLAIHRENNSSLTRGILTKIKRNHLVPCEFYRRKYVGLGLFIKKLLRVFCKNVLTLIGLG